MRLKNLLVAFALTMPVIVTAVNAESSAIDISIQTEGTDESVVQVVPADDLSASILESETVYVTNQSAVISFTPDKEGDYRYDVFQQETKDDGVVLDDTVYKVHLHSEYDVNNSLNTVAVLYKGDSQQKADAIRFENSKKEIPFAPDTRDDTKTVRYLFLTALALLVAGVALLIRAEKK